MKKKILMALLGMSLIYGSSSVDAMRYFMQGDNPASPTPYGNNPSIGKYVQAGDAKIYYEVYGEGKPIAIFHGGGVGNGYELGGIIDDLRFDHQVIVITTRGHGKSEIGHTPLTYEQKARDMMSAIRQVTNEPVQIIGFSDGAYTAYKFATMYPEKVDRIVAIGAGTLDAGYFSGEMKVEDMQAIDPEFMKIELQMRPEPERIQEFYTKYMDFWSKMSVGEEVFGKIQCPVLLIVGDEDDHAPVVTVLKAHQMIPNSRLLVVPKAYHGAFNSNYDVVRPAIMQFVYSDVSKLDSSNKVAYNSEHIR